MPETLQINVDFDAAAVDPILERILATWLFGSTTIKKA
jgi:hypothetical protein